jgi:hypothetical protein
MPRLVGVFQPRIHHLEQNGARAGEDWTSSHVDLLGGGSLPEHEAGSSRRLLLAHSSVDPLAEEVGVAVVPCVLLDHVHQHFAQHVPLVADDVKAGRLGHVLLRERDLCPPRVPRPSATTSGSGTAPLKSAFRSASERKSRVPSCPAIRSRIHDCSTPARWRTNPNSDMLEGGTERRAGRWHPGRNTSAPVSGAGHAGIQPAWPARPETSHRSADRHQGGRTCPTSQNDERVPRRPTPRDQARVTTAMNAL